MDVIRTVKEACPGTRPSLGHLKLEEFCVSGSALKVKPRNHVSAYF